MTKLGYQSPGHIFRRFPGTRAGCDICSAFFRLPLLILLLAPVQPQTQQDGPSLKIRTSLVEVNLLAKSSDGKKISDLAKEDLLVYEDNELQSISAFSKQKKNLSIALMVDSSGSMYNGPLMRAKLISDEIIGCLGEKDEVALFDVGKKPELLQESTNNIELVGRGLIELAQPRRGMDLPKAGNGIHVHDTIFEGAKYLKTRPADRQRVVIVVSDNKTTPSNSASSSEAMSEALENDVIVAGFLPTPRRFGGVIPSRNLNQYVHGSVKKYAEETGGETLTVEAPGDREAFRGARLPASGDLLSQDQIAQIKAVMERLRSAYVLTYYLKENDPGARERKVKVELTEAAKASHGKVKLVYRKRYIHTGK